MSEPSCWGGWTGKVLVSSGSVSCAKLTSYTADGEAVVSEKVWIVNCVSG